MIPERVVIDTNALISAAAGGHAVPARRLRIGDADLLCLGSVQSVQIVTPGQALTALMKRPGRPTD